MFLLGFFDITNAIFDYTFGLIIKLFLYILNHVLPHDYLRVIYQFGDQFYKGIKTTLTIAIFGTLFGFIIALIFGYVRTLKIKKKDSALVKTSKIVFQTIAKIYITIFRGTPMMVQALIIYYGFIKIFHWDPATASLIIVSINSGAYLSEVIKDGINSIDIGQTEAARSLGFSQIKTLLLVVYPQAIKNSMAAIGNEIVINIKDTSVLNVIGCAEMFNIANISAAKDYNYMEQMITVALVYLLLTYTATKILHFIEKRLDVKTVALQGSN